MKKLLARQGFTLVELMIVVAIMGLLAAMAIPNFIQFQARSKQAEARTNLKAMFQAMKSYYAEKDGYSADLTVMGFSPERGNRYAYQVGSTAAWQTRSQASAGNEGNPNAIQVDTYKFPAEVAAPAALSTNITVTLDGAASAAPCPGVITGSNGSFCGTATGSIDNDPFNDGWAVGGALSLTVAASSCSEQQNGVAGTPVNNLNDVACE